MIETINENLILDARDGAGNSIYRDMVDFDTLDLLS